ncbi:MAG: hypothetical protein JXP34_27320 [Planctomycetes bacterium]|nr:hypothetical protein [Planctomycetota bacterium]
MKTGLLVSAAVCGLVVLLSGCHDSHHHSRLAGLNPSGLPTLGELHGMIAKSTAPDTDGDYLPDDVEAVLDTDPDDRDTDRDGLMDNYEVFGTGTYADDDYVPDGDQDGAIAAVDADDDDDGVNDGMKIDSDGDGIPNYLEYYGYAFEWLTGQIIPWDGNPDVPHWRSDPLQFSTDQDPFGDGTEVSGTNMDVSVEEPGDDPLVPAYPNVVVKLEGYSVTLNEEITYSEGASLAKGMTWNRETTETHSFAQEQNWSAGLEIGYASSSFHCVVSANYGQSTTSTYTTSTAVAFGQSVLEETNWSRARSYNPTEAARIKLFLRVHNLGTSCVSNIIPTLTLRIGGLNVATFEPGNAQINILVPGGRYPSEPGVNWVVDSIDTGAGIAPLTLTMDELRALERGAPVSLTMTQLLGDVMRWGADGGWDRGGDTNEYVARCDAVCANLRFDMGDGSSIHQLVYADDSVSAPTMTLGEALRLLGIDDEGGIPYYDTDGRRQRADLEGWTFVFDPQTLAMNGFDLSQSPPAPPWADFDAADLILGPDATVLAKMPRDPNDPGLQIHFAYVDPQSHEIRVCASDYQGVEGVDFVDKKGLVTALAEEFAGAGFFSIYPDPGYIFDGTERIVAASLSGQQVHRYLPAIYVPQPLAPVINGLSLDLNSRRLYANITNPAPTFPIEWVRAFHPGLPNGYLAMEEPPNAYEDPDGWECQLPENWGQTNLKVVAFVSEGVYAERFVADANVVRADALGSTTLGAEHDWTATDEYCIDVMHLDPPVSHSKSCYEPLPSNWTPAAGSECYLRWNNSLAEWVLCFTQPSIQLTGADFDTLTRDQCMGYELLPAGQCYAFNIGDVYVVHTSEGRLAKLTISSRSTDSDWWTNWRGCNAGIRYVVFSRARANAGPDQSVLVDPAEPAVMLNGAGSASAVTYVWSFESVPEGSSLTDGDLDGAATVTPTFEPDVAGTYVVRLVINDDESQPDTVAIDVEFPAADAGANFERTFYAGSDPPIQLDGEASAGALSYEWEWAERPAGSAAALVDRFSAKPSFTPDASGVYRATLTINKAYAERFRSQATVAITVTVEAP